MSRVDVTRPKHTVRAALIGGIGAANNGGLRGLSRRIMMAIDLRRKVLDISPVGRVGCKRRYT